MKSRWPKASWTEKGSDDFKRVVKLLQSGANLAEIGEVFGVSRERARQIREKIRKRYGDQIVQPRKQPYVTLREAARELNTDPGPLQKLLQKNGMLTKNPRGIWVVQRSDLKRKKVTQHPHITQEQVCKYCGKKFRLKHRAQKVCSAECSEARRKDSRLRCFESEPSEDNLAGWHKELWLRLQRHRPPAAGGMADANPGLGALRFDADSSELVASAQGLELPAQRNAVLERSAGAAVSGQRN